MNALDLAKRLDKYAEYSGGDWEFYENIAKILRQQQAEIEGLKAKTLTDEEIKQVWLEFDARDTHDWFIAIARAILLKAQK